MRIPPLKKFVLAVPEALTGISCAEQIDIMWAYKTEWQAEFLESKDVMLIYWQFEGSMSKCGKLRFKRMEGPYQQQSKEVGSIII